MSASAMLFAMTGICCVLYWIGRMLLWIDRRLGK